MKLNKVFNNVNRIITKSKFKIKKHSPEILLITGIASGIAATVTACVATVKAVDDIKDAKEEIQDLKDEINGDVKPMTPSEIEEKTRELSKVYLRTGVNVVKLYLPSLALGAASISSILGSHKIMNGRNVALATAYSALDKAFRGYRDRVKEKYGEEEEFNLRYDLKEKTIEKIVEGKDGKKKKVKEKVKVIDGNPEDISIYARFFDEFSRNYVDSPEYNLTFLRQTEHWANDRLQANGILFLNEVYEALDIPRTKAGQHVGWYLDKDNPKVDNYVSFGIYNVNREENRNFVNGIEKAILLDFNVDGDIIDKI